MGCKQHLNEVVIPPLFVYRLATDLHCRWVSRLDDARAVFQDKRMRSGLHGRASEIVRIGHVVMIGYLTWHRRV
jgi:hypothetical protein